jgi:AraC-like DNA-binding protein
MKQLTQGEFYGQTNKTLRWDGITITDTEYTHDKVDWHYHENAYLTFILQGKVLEGNKKEIHYCTPGSVLFHHSQDAHYNIKPKGFTRGFHIEIAQNWWDTFDTDSDKLNGSINIGDPGVKLLLYKIFRETKIDDSVSAISTEQLLLHTLDRIQRQVASPKEHNPVWVSKIEEIIRDQFSGKLTLNYLSKTLEVHPVHISRAFPKYFNCGLGEYIRKIKVEKSLALLPDRKNALVEIALDCGFSDQSHFIRSFKEVIGTTPANFQKSFSH